MKPQHIKIAAPTFRIVGSRRKLNEYELRTCMLMVAQQEMAPFVIINKNGQRVLVGTDGRLSTQVEDFDLGAQLAISLHRVHRLQEREIQNTLNA